MFITMCLNTRMVERTQWERRDDEEKQDKLSE